MRFVILLLTLFYSSLALASGPVTRFERLSLEDGLSQVSVASIAQDQEGFIWFATQDGLNRYDGYEFKVFRHDPASPNSISNSWVRVIHIDSSGTLWIGTNGSGIDKYDPQSESFIHYQHQPGNPNSLSHNTVRAIFSDANGTLWVGTDGGLNQFDNQSNQFVHFSHHATDPHSLSHNHVKAIYQDSKSNLWIGTDDGLNKLDASQFNQPSTAKPLHFEHFKHQPSNPHSLSHNEVKAINEDASGTLWVGTLGGGINKLDSQTGLFSHYKNIDGDPNSISNDYIMSIDKDAQGILWIGTEGGGLNRFDGTDQQMIHFRHQTSDTHSLSADFVDIVFESDDGTLWIGTNNGLSKYNRKQALFGHFNHQISAPFSLSHNGINAFAQSPDGILWIGTDDGLNRFDAQSQQFHHFKHQPSDPNSLSHNTIGALVFDHQGRLWVGTLGGGLDLFDQTTGQFSHFRHQPTNPHSVSHNRIKSLTVDSDGTLWVGTLGGGLDKFDHHSQRFKHFVHQPNNADSLSHNRISAIYQDSKGKLWIGTTGGGLNQFDINDEKFVRFKHHRSDEGSLSHDYILSIIEDSKGSLWIGTGGGGLNHYNRQTSAFTYYSEKHGLPNDIVYAALEDKAGFLWLSTNQGLCKFNPASRTCRNFDVSDGLQSNEFNLGAYFKSADGELFFGGVNGFNRFYPQMQKDQRQAPTVVLTKLLLFNQSVPIRALNAHNTHHLRFTLGKAVNQLDQLTLNHQQNLMTFEFAALDFISPMKNQYAYQLEGWDKNWIYTDAKNRRATYTNIPPGRYTLRVKASNGHAQNQWQQAGKSLKITLLPPPWLTWWAYLIYSLIFTALLSALVILLVHLLSEQKNRQGQQLILDQLQQVDKLKDEFLTHTSHELRTPLNGIIGLTESLIAGAAGVLPNKANHKLAVVASSGKRLAHLVDNILDFSRLKDNTLPLYPSAIDLRAITDMVLTLSHPLVSHKNLGLINDVSAKLPKVHADETRLQQILYNLVSNAIKFTEQGSVTVSATPINDWQWLEISVCDTGIGIAPDQFGTIFESFGQVHNASTNAHQHDGSGLGLTVSQQLVMLHGGSINVDSTLGEGTTLRFTLPIATADSGPNQSADVQQRQADILAVEAQFDSWQYQQAAHDGSRFHLLLVDDESEQREILYHHLSSRNYRLTQAGGGKQALQMMAEQGPFDLILLDILMPDMSGYDVCNQIRQTFPVNDLPVIFLTAQNQVVDVVQSFAIGANDYLNKPVAKHELLARVETHLRLLDINRNLEHKVADRTHELEQSNRRTTELIDVCTEITATLDRNKLLDIAFKHIRELMDADALMIGHFQKHLDCIIFNLGIENNEYLPTFFVGMDEPAQPAIWCIEHREPVIINDLDLDYARYFGDQPRGDPLIGRPTASLMYWPLIVGDQVIGVLSVQSYKKHAYDAHHQALIQTLVPTLAIALDNTVAYRQIEQKNREVKEKHREIVATQQQLVQAEKMASLGTLTAGVAHEINNPTNFVHVSAQNLRVDLSKFQTFLLNLAGENADEAILDSFKARFEPLYTHLATIENGTERIKTIVRDLRTFSQLDAATKKTVKITELLQSTVHLIHTNFLEITQFTTEFMDTPAVPCYPAQLNQVFMNLMVNACDAIRDKQRQQREQHEADCANQANTTDYHKTELGQITIGCRLIDDKVEITIKDTGCGMSAETQKRLFEPFYTTKDVGEGTGLGLSISFGIVQKHEGELSVTSELGSGTVFTLLLPVGDVA